MKKIIIFLVFFCPLQVMAQLFYSPNQQMVESAIRNGIFILSQDYQLKDTTTNEYFGRNGQEEFGKTFSLGIKVEKGYCYLDPVQRPWLYDNNFERYRASHVPQIYKTRFKEFTDSLMTECASFNLKKSVELYPETVYYMPDPISFKGQGFHTDSTPGNKQGWVVWVVVDKPLTATTPSDSIAYLIYRKELDVKADSLKYAINVPTTTQTVIGGIFVEPVQSQIGQLTFNLIGVITPEGDKWNILTPFKQPLSSPAVAEATEENELTPAREEENGRDDVYDNERTNKKKDKKRKK